jgi:hypothetical protein
MSPEWKGARWLRCRNKMSPRYTPGSIDPDSTTTTCGVPDVANGGCGRARQWNDHDVPRRVATASRTGDSLPVSSISDFHMTSADAMIMPAQHGQRVRAPVSSLLARICHRAQLEPCAPRETVCTAAGRSLMEAMGLQVSSIHCMARTGPGQRPQRDLQHTPSCACDAQSTAASQLHTEDRVRTILKGNVRLTLFSRGVPKDRVSIGGILSQFVAELGIGTCVLSNAS